MWAVLRRVLAGVGLLVSVIGFVGFATAAIGVWRVKVETNRRTDALAGQARSAIGAADRTVKFVHEVIEKGKEELKVAREAVPAPQERVNPFLQLTARRASENLAGSVDRANTAVLTASDAAVVAEAALDLFGEDDQMKDLKTWLGVKPEQLTQTRRDLDTASRELKKVRELLGVQTGAGAPPPELLVTVESALNQAGGFTDQMEQVVAGARTRVDETKRKVDLWVLRLALGATAIGALGAAGQFFMARFCWRALRGRPA